MLQIFESIYVSTIKALYKHKVLNVPVNACRPLLYCTQYYGGCKEAYGNSPVCLPETSNGSTGHRNQMATLTLSMKITYHFFSSYYILDTILRALQTLGPQYKSRSLVLYFHFIDEETKVRRD